MSRGSARARTRAPARSVGDHNRDAMAGGGALESIKEQLRALPDNGLGYGVLHYLKQTAAHLEGFASPQINAL